MAMTHLQYALSKLAEANTKAAEAALICQQFGMNHIIPNDHMRRTAGELLHICLRHVASATHFVEAQTPVFELVPNTQSALNGMDKMRIQMGYAIEAGTVENFEDEEEEDEE